MKVSPILAILAIVATFLVGYWLGAYNHEKDIVRACEVYTNAAPVSWTGELGSCKKVDDDYSKDAITIK